MCRTLPYMGRTPNKKSQEKREIRAFPKRALHARIAGAAEKLHMSISGWLLLAAEEKLARDGRLPREAV